MYNTTINRRIERHKNKTDKVVSFDECDSRLRNERILRHDLRKFKM
jgi:hypothetical protein